MLAGSAPLAGNVLTFLRCALGCLVGFCCVKMGLVVLEGVPTLWGPIYQSLCRYAVTDLLSYVHKLPW
jgi:hypothetical protein